MRSIKIRLTSLKPEYYLLEGTQISDFLKPDRRDFTRFYRKKSNIFIFLQPNKFDTNSIQSQLGDLLSELLVSVASAIGIKASEVILWMPLKAALAWE